MNLSRVRRGRAIVAGVGLLLLVMALLAARGSRSLAAASVGTIRAAKDTFVREVVAEGLADLKMLVDEYEQLAHQAALANDGT